MYEDRQSIAVFERQHARDRLAEEARHVDEENPAGGVGGHLAAEIAERRTMRFVALALVVALTAGALLLS